MTKIRLVRVGRGVRMWSVDSNKFDDALDDVMKKVYNHQHTMADKAPIIEVRFLLNQEFYTYC